MKEGEKLKTNQDDKILEGAAQQHKEMQHNTNVYFLFGI